MPACTGQAFRPLISLLVLLLCLVTACDRDAETGTFYDQHPASTLGPGQIALIVNDSDPVSREIADYYAIKRHIPLRNIIHVRFVPGSKVMRPEEFRVIKASVDARAPSNVQAFALAWTLPWRVGCMSVTTAFAAGFDADFCAATCKPTRPSPYFDSNSQRPSDDFGWRPAILLAGNDFDEVSSLIDRGVAADGTRPEGSGYLLSTSDRARNTRARFYSGILLMQSDRFKLHAFQRDILRYRPDIMFYFTGLKRVDGLDTNTFLPGAIADHLTSAGGKLTTGGHQMSSLRWLEAGATGSYGAVSEPCNFPQKFPRPDIVIGRYLNGETLLESYWKSVEWPGQGVFIGEPLAAPFRE